MDFYQIRTKETKNGIEVFPDFTVGRSKDLMVRGRSFYAIWDEERGLWSTDEYDVQRIVDQDLFAFAKKKSEATGVPYIVKDLRSFDSNSWNQFRKFVSQISDNSHQLDQNLTFANTDVKKSDYVSRRLPYSLNPGDYSAWDELVGTLYSVEERAKLEWAIGAIISGDSKKIQKFLVLYGPAGTGKSTILNVIEKLFEGYTTSFEAKALGGNSNAFSTEVFKHNPLVAIQHDGDLSKIEDNTKLNSIISHEEMTMNEKYKPSYTARVNAFLLMGTNQPVKISDAKSGIIRRLIDVHPTGVIIPTNHYHTLMAKVDFELGAIAHHCLQTYLAMGKNYYSGYRPLEMMLQTDVFFNFIEANFDIFKAQDSTTLKQAYSLYKEFCADTGIEKVLPQYKVREELRNYFDEFRERAQVDGDFVRSMYVGFNANKFKQPSKDNQTAYSLVMEETTSIFDELAADWPAQYATKAETPRRKWDKVASKLKNLNTSELHFVQVPENHIVIDFDLKGENGEKSLERNLEAASVWPATYAELSKGGAGVHLHYNYTGDVHSLGSSYSEGIEIKTLLGDSSLRRKLSKCNNFPVAELPGGLPVKEKTVLSENAFRSEKGLRDLIVRNLKKEIHPNTKTSIDFIKKILDDAYSQGLHYNVEDMRGAIVAFASNSSNRSFECLKTVQQMRFLGPGMTSEGPEEPEPEQIEPKDQRISIYDVEVYPNLFVICWKFLGDPTVVRMINPTSVEVEQLVKLRLVGFYNRRYDNHILYAAMMGYSNMDLFRLSQKIISNERSALFSSAFDLSYADIWDFSSKKQSLKKFQIELGLHHQELDIPWDQPVPEDQWERVVDYCVNDVLTTEGVFEARAQDFIARQILADLSGLTVNDTTQKHTARIIFGNDRNPQASFNYTDLSKDFPGYVYDSGKSTYRGEVVGEGGYVYAETGMYDDVVVLDVASMHPTSIVQLNFFGEYTPNFQALMDARLAIKRRDYDSAKKMLNGKLEPYLQNPAEADALSYALKIVINIVYGLTSAKFDNPFRHRRNKDNIVAKRGALFMIDLKNACQEKGLQVVHIKTDSIKIPGATAEDIEEIIAFGEKWGYKFEHEDTYEKFCLVNDAVYIARKEDGSWEAVGAQFQHPYVFKQLFTHEEITFDDMCETKQVTQGTMYLNYEHDIPDPLPDGMKFIGRTGRFVPVTNNGGTLFRVKDDKSYAVAGTKGHLWMEAETALAMGDEVEIDMTYFDKLLDSAYKTIEKFGDFESFVS